jgi:hypothetical protein
LRGREKRAEFEAAGNVLLCVSRAKGNVRLDA